MSDDDLPIVAFKGEHSDAVFLVSLLESEGIDVTLKKNLWVSPSLGRGNCRLFG